MADLSKVLITGGCGMLGSYIDFGIKTDRAALDVTDFGAVESAFEKYKPEAVLHLAAETDVDRCERDPARAYLINAVGTYNVALAAKKYGAKMIYISTAGVFDGEKEGLYTEEDLPNPQNHYGHSKYLGELAVKSLPDDYLILRVCWMMGGGPLGDKKFVAKIMKQLRSGAGEIKAITDQIGSPTFAGDLARAIKILIRDDRRGVLHLPNQEAASRYDVAKFIADFINPRVKVVSVDSSYFNLDAKRTKNESLVSDASLMRPWREALRDYLKSEWGDYLLQKDATLRDSCRICEGRDFAPILDLGEMPPANSFIKEEEKSGEKRFPLVVYFCENCKLLQLLDVVNPEILFKNYSYFTSASQPLVEHFERMADTLAERFIDSKKELIVEIGGNDGALLKRIRGRCRVLNVEPSLTASETSKSEGIETLIDFFSENLAERIIEKYGHAKVIAASNVIAHIDDLNGTFKGVDRLLADDGAFLFEVHWVGNLIGEGGFDQIYHEHLCYFSLTALDYLAKKLGLTIFDVELVPIHGESLRVYVGKSKNQGENVKKFLERERALGLDKKETFLKFKKRVERNKSELVNLLASLKREGKVIAGYGAPAKGNTLLNYCGANRDFLDFIIDTTPAKQGKLAPGSHIPIWPPAKIKEAKPDYFLLLAWNYAPAILEKESELRKHGVKFILPVPEPKII